MRDLHPETCRHSCGRSADCIQALGPHSWDRAMCGSMSSPGQLAGIPSTSAASPSTYQCAWLRRRLAAGVAALGELRALFGFAAERVSVVRHQQSPPVVGAVQRHLAQQARLRECAHSCSFSRQGRVHAAQEQTHHSLPLHMQQRVAAQCVKLGIAPRTLAETP